MASPIDRIPKWATNILRDQLDHVSEKLNPETLDGLRKRFDSVVADLPGAAAREMDRFLGDAKSTFGGWTEWLRQQASLSTEAINGSGILFQPLCKLQGGAREHQTHFESTFHNSVAADRVQRALRSACIELAGKPAIVASSFEAAIIAAASIQESSAVAVPRCDAIRLSSGITIPDLLRSANLTVDEIGSVEPCQPEDLHSYAGTSQNGFVLFRTDRSIREPAELDVSRYSEGSRPARTIVASNTAAAEDFADVLNTPLSTISKLVKLGGDVSIVPGDEMLGGPNCGLIFGDEEVLRKLESSPSWPLHRATLSTASGITMAMRMWIDQDNESGTAIREMFHTSTENLSERADRLATKIEGTPGLEITITHDNARLWNNQEWTIPSVQLRPRRDDRTSEDWSKELLSGAPAIVTRTENDAIVIDLRFVDPSCDVTLAKRIAPHSKQDESLSGS